MALFGNLLVLSAFWVFRRLRTVTNFFIISLAVADILVAVVSMPVWAAYLIGGPSVILSSWLNKVWNFMDILCGVASIVHLCFISLERCICISSPLTYHDTVTTEKAKIAISCIWIFAAIMAGLKIVLWNTPPPVYELAVTISCFIIPLIIMTGSYMKMFTTARHQIKKMILTVQGKPKRFLLSKEIKAAKTVAVVIGGFVICWCPFFVLNLMYGLCEACRPLPTESILVAKWMHYVNSVLNPIIYACMNKDFRKAFKKHLMYACACMLGKSYSGLLRESRSLHSETGWSFRGTSFRSRNGSVRSYADSYTLRSNYNSIEMGYPIRV
ncbi:predicted protein [Nematostella vectensis]|uniref:G-protein coupled receptors family 1 profile domain-containing protein n=2 Tax=Nematostella vectensis TaxID=45351 RepID=A7SM05_NEMVE|nr:predicted protein [Nematostella vectensis]|eukprot:XP_001627392.1 predicted protein [Nematostella vectensis]